MISVIIDPKWTFIEALEYADSTCEGGLHPQNHQIKVLHQWANVVGRQRAMTELEYILANEHLKLSPRTVKLLREGFKGMPIATPCVYANYIAKPAHMQKDVSSPLELPIPVKKEDDIDSIVEKLVELSSKKNVDPLLKLVNCMAQKGQLERSDHEAILRLMELSQNAGSEAFNHLIKLAHKTGTFNFLGKADVRELQDLNAAIGIKSLKEILYVWELNKDNGNEDFWHNLFVGNTFLFSQLFYFPVAILAEKAYVGGKNIKNQGGKLVDFLCANNLTKNVALVEIKTPKTTLLSSTSTKYRDGVYNVSAELSGSILQSANYRNSIIKNYYFLSALNPEEDLPINTYEVFSPSCLVIIGNGADELNSTTKRKSFELFRTGLKDIQVVTYDELFGKVRCLIDLLENGFED
jgi:hypothetical protein